MFNKKLLLTALVAVAGYLGYKRVQSDKAEQDLWAEATDPVPPRDQR
ncbi:MAG: DLW-39 family protein [Jiangellaceae bacterium]